MPTMSALDLLLHQLEWGVVETEKYSKKSVYGRLEPMLRTVALAAAAVVTGVVLGSPPAPAR